MRRRLDADHQVGLFLHAADVRLQDVEIRIAVVMACVEIDIRDVRFGARGLDDLHDIFDRLLVPVVRTQVQTDRAEFALLLVGLLQPVVAHL